MHSLPYHLALTTWEPPLNPFTMQYLRFTSYREGKGTREGGAMRPLFSRTRGAEPDSAVLHAHETAERSPIPRSFARMTDLPVRPIIRPTGGGRIRRSGRDLLGGQAL